MKVGDIVEIEGVKRQITYVSGKNFSYRDHVEKRLAEHKAQEEALKADDQEEQKAEPKKRSRKK